MRKPVPSHRHGDVRDSTLPALDRAKADLCHHVLLSAGYASCRLPEEAGKGKGKGKGRRKRESGSEARHHPNNERWLFSTELMWAAVDLDLVADTRLIGRDLQALIRSCCIRDLAWAFVPREHQG